MRPHTVPSLIVGWLNKTKTEYSSVGIITILIVSVSHVAIFLSYSGQRMIREILQRAWKMSHYILRCKEVGGYFIYFDTVG